MKCSAPFPGGIPLEGRLLRGPEGIPPGEGMPLESLRVLSSACPVAVAGLPRAGCRCSCGTFFPAAREILSEEDAPVM